MPRPGDILASVIGGGLQGFVQGRQAKLQRESAQAERDRQYKMDQSREERQNQKLLAEQEKRNMEISGQKEFTGLLSAIGGMSDMTPSNEFMKIRAQAIDAATRGGLDLKTAGNLIDQAILRKGVEEPLSPIEEEKLRKAGYDTERAKQEIETEKERTRATRKLGDERASSDALNRAKAKNLSQELFSKPIEEMSDAELIQAGKKINENIRGFGRYDEYESKFVPYTPDLAAPLQIYSVLAKQYAEEIKRRQLGQQQNPQQLGPLGPPAPGLDQFSFTPMEQTTKKIPGY